MIRNGKIITIEDEKYYIKEFFDDNLEVLKGATYTIKKDKYGFYVNVDGDVALNNLGLIEIPIRFGEVRGSFGCTNNKLTSLLGAPHTVRGVFNCMYNSLTTLEHCPKHWEKEFICVNNELESFEGICPVPDMASVTIWASGNQKFYTSDNLYYLLNMGFEYPNICVYRNGERVEYTDLGRIWAIKQISK